MREPKISFWPKFWSSSVKKFSVLSWCNSWFNPVWHYGSIVHDHDKKGPKFGLGKVFSWSLRQRPINQSFFTAWDNFAPHSIRVCATSSATLPKPATEKSTRKSSREISCFLPQPGIAPPFAVGSYVKRVVRAERKITVRQPFHWKRARRRIDPSNGFCA